MVSKLNAVPFHSVNSPLEAPVTIRHPSGDKNKRISIKIITLERYLLMNAFYFEKLYKNDLLQMIQDDVDIVERA